MTVNVPSNETDVGTATITFRGTRDAIEFAKELVTAICCQRDENLNFNMRARMLLMSITTSVSDFFHARTGPQGCLLGGWLRIGYATLFILDRLLWTVDLEYFFYQSGVLPTRVTRSYDYIEPYTMLTIFPAGTRE